MLGKQLHYSLAGEARQSMLLYNIWALHLFQKRHQCMLPLRGLQTLSHITYIRTTLKVACAQFNGSTYGQCCEQIIGTTAPALWMHDGVICTM